MDRLEIVTFILWGVGIALLIGAGLSAMDASWPAVLVLAVLGLVALGLGGIRPLGALLWHGIAETVEIGKAAE